MGMFDRQQSLTKSELANGEFVLERGKYVGVVNSQQYGDNQKAIVTCRRVGGGPSNDYVVFGVLADQISRMESSDLPAVVRIIKDGDANVWDKVRDLGPND